jgi:hypothetical protein
VRGLVFSEPDGSIGGHVFDLEVLVDRARFEGAGGNILALQKDSDDSGPSSSLTLMAAVVSSMVNQSLVAVADPHQGESLGRRKTESGEHENSVEHNVILPGQVVDIDVSLSLIAELNKVTVKPTDFQLPSALITTSQSDNDLHSSQVAEALAPAQSSSPPPTDPSRSPASPKLPPSPKSPNFVAMPGLSDLTDLILHSPSSQIVGTPFATDSTRFEYPFPDTAAAEPSASPSPPPSNAFLAAIAQNDPVLPKMGKPFHSHAAPSAVPSTTTSSPTGNSLASYGLPHSEINVSYNPAHPKLKKNANPPIPPSLAKKSKKWSLNLMGRRRSSSGQSSASAGTAMLSEFSSNLSSPTGTVARANLILDGGLSLNSPPPASSTYCRGR